VIRLKEIGGARDTGFGGINFYYTEERQQAMVTYCLGLPRNAGFSQVVGQLMLNSR
jgi:hypothetical protein